MQLFLQYGMIQKEMKHRIRRKEREDDFQMIKYLHRYVFLMKLLLLPFVVFLFINTTSSVFAADTTPNIPGVCTKFNPNGTPNMGKVRMPVFLVDFSDEHFSENALSADKIAHILFSNETGSMTTFIKNASYNQLLLSGDVFFYTAQHPSSFYESDVNGFEKLSEEVLNAFDDQLNYNNYDSNNDGYIDTFVLTIVGSHDYWYGCQATWYNDTAYSVDGVKPMCYIINDAQPYSNKMNYFVEEMCHEFGHCMGLPDYYKYNLDDDYDAMNGVAGSEIMDEMEGDFCQFSKLMLGWLKEDEVSIYTGGTAEYTLDSSALQGSCVLIPVNFEKLNEKTVSVDQIYTGEYFLIQYDTMEKNMTDVLNSGRDSGIRILHIDAETRTDTDGTVSFKYDNNSPLYDASHNGRRIIRLVNDNNGYFHKGDTIDGSTPGFAWYNSKGKETIDPEITITVGAEKNMIVIKSHR